MNIKYVRILRVAHKLVSLPLLLFLLVFITSATFRTHLHLSPFVITKSNERSPEIFKERRDFPHWTVTYRPAAVSVKWSAILILPVFNSKVQFRQKRVNAKQFQVCNVPYNFPNLRSRMQAPLLIATVTFVKTSLFSTA
jgi:hypothetical protein